MPGVGSKPLPLIVPIPLMFKKVDVCETITEDVRSNVKPPTFHRLGVFVDGLKIQGAAIAAVVPGVILEKSPESCKTKELFQTFTLVAVPSDSVSKVTTPAKSMLPVMGAALSAGAKEANANKIDIVMIVIRFFMLPPEFRVKRE